MNAPLLKQAQPDLWLEKPNPSSGIRVIPCDFIPLHFSKSVAAAAW